jgi:23S rRNA (uridine2552-2'-O)-methyltransferase
VLEQPRDAMHEDSRLAAAGAGKNEKWSFMLIDGFELTCVECHRRNWDGARALRVGQPGKRSNRRASTQLSSYQRKDAAYHTAKRVGLRSRAGVKLEDLDARFRLLAHGSRVVDLGCWPGAWLQVASRRVGLSGVVVGVDLAAIEPLHLANVTTIVGDAGDPEVQAGVIAAAHGPIDVVLSDLSPKLTGVRVTDEAREEALVEVAIDFANRVLAPRGRLLVKLFSGVEPAMTKRLRASFTTVTTWRPPSTRKGSSEIYAMATGRRGEANPPPAKEQER